MRIFLAGATGVIGTRLIPLLVDGHVVAGMTRSAERPAWSVTWVRNRSCVTCTTRRRSPSP